MMAAVDAPRGDVRDADAFRDHAGAGLVLRFVTKPPGVAQRGTAIRFAPALSGRWNSPTFPALQ
jgi:hypothetical protein